jgi:Leucine-rich repeat (LRR) protein
MINDQMVLFVTIIIIVSNHYNHLKNLNYLNLQNNKLKSLPDYISRINTQLVVIE